MDNLFSSAIFHVLFTLIAGPIILLAVLLCLAWDFITRKSFSPEG